MYKEFLILFSFIIFHELGHFLTALLFNWNIDKISIYPYGGCVKFNNNVNSSIKEEFLILISGPLFQVILFFIISIFFNFNYISYRDYIIIKSYHYTLLSFNLLPIYPLDGGKLLNLVSNYFISYKKSNKIIIYISYLVVVCLLIKFKDINMFLMIFFLITEITKYLKNQNYLFNKFLLERYLYNYKFKRTKIITSKDRMYRNQHHIFKIDNKYINEKDYLKERYKNI